MYHELTFCALEANEFFRMAGPVFGQWIDAHLHLFRCQPCRGYCQFPNENIHFANCAFMSHLPPDISVPYIGSTLCQPSHPPLFEHGAFGHAPFSGRAFAEPRSQEPMFGGADYSEEYVEDDLDAYSDNPYSDEEAIFGDTLAHASRMGFGIEGAGGNRTSGRRGPFRAEREATGWGAAGRLSAGWGGMAVHGGPSGHGGVPPVTSATTAALGSRAERSGHAGRTGRAGAAGAGGLEVIPGASGRLSAGEAAGRRGTHSRSAAPTRAAEPSDGSGCAGSAGRVTDIGNEEGPDFAERASGCEGVGFRGIRGEMRHGTAAPGAPEKLAGCGDTVSVRGSAGASRRSGRHRLPSFESGIGH